MIQSIIVHRVSFINEVEIMMQAMIDCGSDVVACVNDSTGYFIYGRIGINQNKREVNKNIALRFIELLGGNGEQNTVS